MYLIIKPLASHFPHGKLKAIAETTERYISVSVDVVVGEYLDKKGKTTIRTIELRFIDSLRFMQASLDSLVGNLVEVQSVNYID